MTRYRRHTANSNPVVIRKPVKTTGNKPTEAPKPESACTGTMVSVEEVYKTILRKLTLDELTVVTAMAHQYRGDKAAELFVIAEKLTKYAKGMVLPGELLLLVLAMREDSMYATDHNNKLPENGVRWLEILQAEYGKHCPGYVAL